MSIVTTIRELRKVAGFTQTQLADKIGVSLPSVARWEAGKNCPESATLYALYQLAVALKRPDFAREFATWPIGGLSNDGDRIPIPNRSRHIVFADAKPKSIKATDFVDKYIVVCEINGEWLLHPEAFDLAGAKNHVAGGWTPDDATRVCALQYAPTKLIDLGPIVRKRKRVIEKRKLTSRS